MVNIKQIYLVFILIGCSGLLLKSYNSIPYFTEAQYEELTPKVMDRYIDLFFGKSVWDGMTVDSRLEGISSITDHNHKMNLQSKEFHKTNYDNKWTQLSIASLFIGIFFLVSPKLRKQ